MKQRLLAAKQRTDRLRIEAQPLRVETMHKRPLTEADLALLEVDVN
jgi:hypothetical protein